MVAMTRRWSRRRRRPDRHRVLDRGSSATAGNARRSSRSLVAAIRHLEPGTALAEPEALL